MPLTTYDELQANIVSELYGRTDKTTEIQDAIRMTEAHCNSRLKCREMDAVSTIPITAGVGTAPTDLQSVHSVAMTVTPYTGLAYEPIEVTEQRRPDVGGTPEVYDIVGEQILTWPPTDSTVRFRYRQNIPALTDSNTSNWLLEKYPHVYVYGSYFQIYKHLKDDTKAQANASMFNASIDELNRRAITTTSANLQLIPSVQAV